MKIGLAAVVLCAAIGCAHTTPRATSTSTANASAHAAATAGLSWYGDLHALAVEAARARGLVLTQSFAITPLEDAAFGERYSQLVAKRARELAPGLAALLTLFHLADRTTPTTMATQAKEVRNEQYLAFYDFDSHAMYVRASLPPSLLKLGDDFRLALLAHEVGHVLQDQRGAAKLFTSTNEFDRLIAVRALLEGDASLTATLVIARRKHWSPERGVERSRLTSRALTPEQLLEATGVSGKLSAAPPLIRELMVFPYFRGAQLLNDLFRAGGLALVDAVLQQPPPASWAIDAPQRWLDGAPGAIAIGPAEKSGELGGLLTRVLLDGCKLDGDLVAYFRGDRFVVTPEVALAWTTRWETEGAAALAEAAFAKLEACWGLPAGGLAVERSGKMVALAESAAGPARAAAIARALHPTIADAGAPPFGRRVIPPVDARLALRSAGEGTWSDDRFHHEPLAVEWIAPGPFRVIPNPSSLFTIKAPGILLVASFIDDESNARTRDQFVNAFMLNFAKVAYHELPAGLTLVTPHAWSEAPPRAVAGFQTHELFSFAGRILTIDFRCRVFPLCGGAAGLYLVALSTTDEAARTADRWLDGLAVTRGDPPLCSRPND